VKESIDIFKHKERALNNGNSFPLSKAWTTALSCQDAYTYNRPLTHTGIRAGSNGSLTSNSTAPLRSSDNYTSQSHLGNDPWVNPRQVDTSGRPIESAPIYHVTATNRICYPGCWDFHHCLTMFSTMKTKRHANTPQRRGISYLEGFSPGSWNILGYACVP
jgi:hypothetical protein